MEGIRFFMSLTPSFKDKKLEPIWSKVQEGKRLDFADGMALFHTPDLFTVGRMANWVTEKRHGKKATYVLNRQCNPTNLCVLGAAVRGGERKRPTQKPPPPPAPAPPPPPPSASGLAVPAPPPAARAR